MKLSQQLHQMCFKEKKMKATAPEFAQIIPDPIKVLDVGVHAEIYTAYYQTKYIVVKRYLNLEKEENAHTLHNEIEVLKYLQGNSKIVQMIAYSPEAIIMEYYPRDLFHIIDKEDYDDMRYRKIIEQMVEGMLYIHSKSVVHRDIKPENILVDRDDRIAYTDFGLAVHLEKGSKLSKQLGTFTIVAPEILLGLEYDEKVDYWSLGVTVYCLLERAYPFNRADTMKEQSKNIFGRRYEKKTQEELIKKTNFSYSLSDEKYEEFLAGLLKVNPDERKLKKIKEKDSNKKCCS